MKKTALLIAVCLLAVAARAIELSLEENRGERGSVGYVDIQRLFADSPDALKAKEGFEDLVRQAEERVNLRKAELLKLHHELDQTRAERDALAMVMDTAPAVSTAAPVSSSTAAAPSPAAPAPTALSAVALSTAAAASNAVALSTSAAARVAVSTAAASPSIKELALPGMAPTTAAPTAPPVAAVAVSSSAAPAPSAKTAAPAAPVITSTGIAAAAALFPAAPAPVPVVAAPKGPTPVQRLLEFDAKIIKIQAEIADKESSLTHEHDEADRGLLDAESRKTDQVLARLYRAVSEVARREGVSVVIDKASILYGQPAVDLTDKVLKYLKENPPQ